MIRGDVALDMDLSRLASSTPAAGPWRRSWPTPTITRTNRTSCGPRAQDRVLEILPRQSRPEGYYRNLVPAAVYCLSPGIFDWLQPRVEQDFLGGLFPRLLAGPAAVYAYATPEYLRDVDTPGACETVQRDLESGLVERMHFSRPRPAVFFDRDGVLNAEIIGRGILRCAGVELLPKAAEAVRKVNRRGWLAVVVTNQGQVAKGLTTVEELERIHARLETLLGRQGAYLDRIYYCPHYPDRGFPGEIPDLKTDCQCRKPKPGLIVAAQRDLPIALGSSCLVGDTWRDMAPPEPWGSALTAFARAMAARGAKGEHGPTGSSPTSPRPWISRSRSRAGGSPSPFGRG